MAVNVQAIPPGFHTVTPCLIVHDAANALDFYKRAFGAIEIFRLPGPEDKIAHAEIRIGNSIIVVSDELRPNKSPHSLGDSTVGILLYVEDIDSVFCAAIEAGAISRGDPANVFWGDRYGKLLDPFGHMWAVATRVEDVPPEEIQKRIETFKQKHS